jgi:hypothetical protein
MTDLTEEKDKVQTRFCYCCKRHLQMSEDDFRKSGHVGDRHSAQKRYGIATNRTPRNSQLGLA